MKRNVYVTNFSGVDTTDAKRFTSGGDIINITEDKVNIFNTDSLVRNIEFKLKDMKAEDLLLLAGNSTIVGYCCMVVLRKFGSVSFLVWNNGESKYDLQSYGLQL